LTVFRFAIDTLLVAPITRLLNWSWLARPGAIVAPPPRCSAGDEPQQLGGRRIACEGSDGMRCSAGAMS
jgi:hypothetical protein